MTRILTTAEKERFASLCALHSAYEIKADATDGIGTFNEKRLHRIIKEFVCADQSCFEVKLGGSVADVFCDGVITEIQTGSFFPLKKKVNSYLSLTDNVVKIIHPIIAKKKIVRVDPLTGEVLRTKASPKKETPSKILPELVYLCDHLRSCRLVFEVYSVTAEEHRYSDEVHRYRKSGRHDSELFPTGIESITSFECTEDFLALIPRELAESHTSFTAAEFIKKSGLKGRRAYNSLTALCAAGVLAKEKASSKAAVYKICC